MKPSPAPVLDHLVAKLPRGKRNKKLIAMLPILAEIVAVNQSEMLHVKQSDA